MFDSICLGVLLLCLMMVVFQFELSDPRINLFIVVGILVSFEPFCVSFTGGSLGHHFARIKITDELTQQRLSLFYSYIRYFVKFFLGGYSLLTYLFTRRYQSLHDLLSGSVVVFKNAESEPNVRKLLITEHETMDGKPTLAKRILISFGYVFLFSFILGLPFSMMISDECRFDSVCSNTENWIIVIESLLYLLAVIAIFVSGIRCKLPGTRVRQ